MINNVFEKRSNFLNEKYYYTKHKSGLDVYLFPKDFSTSYAILGTKYGSIDNRFKKSDEKEFTVVPDGIAHFLEHKMFENENGEDTFSRYARTGAQANAYTSFNMTAYLFSCTSNFNESLEILLDFVTHPYFTPQTVAKEQGIIAQEIRMCEDNPGRALIFGMLKSMYEKNNVKLEIAGTVESISQITADLLYSCYNTFYNLRNMALCVCGNEKLEDIISICDKILTEQPPFDIISVSEEEKPEVANPRFTRKMQVAMPMFAIGIKDVDISSDPVERMRKNAAISVLCNMLFGKSSEYYNTMYEEGVVSGSLDIWNEHNHSYSFISVSGEADNPDEVYARFISMVDKNRKEGLSKEDFERCKRVMYSSILKSFDSTEDIANNFLGYIFDGGDILDFTEIAGDLQYEYVNELFIKMFDEKYYNLTTIMPLDKEEIKK